MLVYANHLRVQGADAEGAVFKAVGGWLKEQLGFGLHPDQLKQDGEYNGHRGDLRSRLRIHGCYDGEPALCAWVLKHADEDVNGRQWIVEVGVKRLTGTLEVSCVVKTDERNTLVSSPVSASQPRVVQYVANNVLSAATDADFVDAVPGEFVRTIGRDRDSYRAFLAEIERRDRDGAIVLVSATRDGEYLVNPTALQRKLVGLAHVVQVLPDSDSYEMAGILGQPWSAWSGAVNVLAIPSLSGVRSRYFLQDAIRAWGDEPQRISQILAWVTASTNIPRQRMHVRPEGVTQLSMRRRLEKVRATSAQMTAAQLRQVLDEASKRADHERDIDDIIQENASLQVELSRYKDDLEETQDKLRTESFQLKSLRDRISSVRDGSGAVVDPEMFLDAALKNVLIPLDCLKLIEQVYVNRCTVLDSARSSARKMTRFIHGRELLDLLKRLVTTYRDALVDGGDTKARLVFGKNEYAAKESEPVMENKGMRRLRTFDYHGTKVAMFSHLKIGVADDPTRTIRVHFHWDGDRQKIVIGYCGEHLSVSKH